MTDETAKELAAAIRKLAEVVERQNDARSALGNYIPPPSMQPSWNYPPCYRDRYIGGGGGSWI